MFEAVSEGFERLTGYLREEAVGQGLSKEAGIPGFL